MDKLQNMNIFEFLKSEQNWKKKNSIFEKLKNGQFWIFEKCYKIEKKKKNKTRNPSSLKARVWISWINWNFLNQLKLFESIETISTKMTSVGDEKRDVEAR